MDTDLDPDKDRLDRGIVRYPDAEVQRYRIAGLWQDRSIPTAFRETAARHGERPALITNRGVLTYRELDHLSDAVAVGLIDLGIAPGDPVILQLTNSEQVVIAWYGLLKAGAIPVCTLAIHRRLEIEQIARQTGAVAHLVQADFPGYDLLALAAQVRALVPALRVTLTIGEASGADGVRVEDLQQRAVDDERVAAL